MPRKPKKTPDGNMGGAHGRKEAAKVKSPNKGHVAHGHPIAGKGRGGKKKPVY